MRINNDQLKFTRFWQADQTSADNAANLLCAAAFQTVGSQLLGTGQQYPCLGFCSLSELSWRKESNGGMIWEHSIFHCSACLCLLTVRSALLCWVDHTFTKFTKTNAIWIRYTQWRVMGVLYNVFRDAVSLQLQN